MTVLAKSPPTVAVRGPTATRRRAMLALARVESIRMLRHPVTVALFLLYLGPWVYDLVRPGGDRYPVLHDEMDGFQLTAMLLLGAAALIVANLAALRDRRDHTDAVTDLLVLPAPWRTAALLTAVLAPAGAALVVTAAQILTLALLPGAAGTIDPFDVVLPAVIVAVLGAAGVLLARVIRSSIAAPLAMVVFSAAGFVVSASAAVGTGWGLLLPTLLDDLPIAVPSRLVDRPTAWHLAYLVGVLAVLSTLALLRSGARARRTLPVLAALLAVTVAAGAAQSVRSDEVRAARVALTADPSPVQPCEVRSGVTYCAFDDFTGWIPSWDAVLSGVVRRIPPGAPLAGPPLAVRQWVWADGYPVHGGFFSADGHADTERAANAAAGTPEAIAIGTAWGDETSAAVFAGGVAYRVVTGRSVAGTAKPCGAQGALIVWLAGQTSTRTADGVRVLDERSTNALIFEEPSLIGTLSVDDRDAAVGLALLDRPTDEVASVVTANWTELTAPTTPIERAADLFGVPVGPAPDAANQSRCDS